MEKKNWKAFYFEGNLYTGHIESPEHWQAVKNAYRGVNADMPLKAKQHRSSEYCYGLYAEYTGDKTLREFFAENGMDV
jgi:hypothetical protein